MKTVTENNFLPPESYVVEVDGKISSVYGLFVEAVKAGMELKQKFPHSHIKVHDLHQTPVPRASNRGTKTATNAGTISQLFDRAQQDLRPPNLDNVIHFMKGQNDG